MKEESLKAYFENKITSKELSQDLIGTRIKTGYDSYGIKIEVIEYGQYEITLKGIVKLCTDSFNGELSKDNLNDIAFALIFSDYFEWNETDEINERISRVLFEWDNPEINYPITKENLILWKKYLETGVHKLS